MLLKRIGHGAFSAVFDLADGSVLKLFRVGGETSVPNKCVGTLSFEAELQAYQALQRHPELEIYVPRFLGLVALSAVHVPEEEIYLPRGIRFERIPGTPQKIGELLEPMHSAADQILEAIKERVGVDDPWDASCFVPGTRAPFTLIDFATPSSLL